MESLGIDLWKLLFQIIAFVIFLFLLNRFALKPIVQMLDDRQVRVRESMAAAQQMQDELTTTAVRNEEVLLEARREAQAILASAREAGDATLARSREEADKQAEAYLSRAQATLQAETEVARQELRKELGDLAVTAASRIIRKELDPATQARVIQETLLEAAGASNGSSNH